MFNERCEVGEGGPSFCWECGKQLVRASGKNRWMFRLVSFGGSLHRVHAECERFPDERRTEAEAQQEQRSKPC
jgi:hypothetical protein